MALIWAGVAVYVLVSRILYDLRGLAFIGARHLQRDAPALERLPRRTLAGIASDAHSHPETAAGAARVLLERRWQKLLPRAAAHRNEAEKWTRIAALRIFVVAEWAIAWALLEDALNDPDEDVMAAAVALLGERDSPRATDLLVGALVVGRHPRSRIATYLEGRDAGRHLVALTDHPDDEVRYWAAALLRPDQPERELALAALAGDPSPAVRAAVAKSFATAADGAGVAAASTLLTDPVWFVRAQAARTLAATGRVDLAARLAPLLREDQWWVRTAAKEALAELGRPVVPLLVTILRDEDRFARNGAAEVLFQLGVVEEWLGGAAPADDIRSLLRAGESQVQQASLDTVAGEAEERLLRMIEQLPATNSA